MKRVEILRDVRVGENVYRAGVSAEFPERVADELVRRGAARFSEEVSIESLEGGSGQDSARPRDEPVEKILGEMWSQEGKNGERTIAPAWKPAPGEAIGGTVLERRQTMTRYGERELIVIDAMIPEEFRGTTPTRWKRIGPVTVWNTAGLERLFKQVNVGDVVRIKYLGKARSSKGREYYSYDWEVVHRS